jgi:CheY-like chemotaxis protein
MTDSFEAESLTDRRVDPFRAETRAHVLIVDDDRAARRLCAGYCDLFDFTCEIAPSAAEAHAALVRERFDVVVMNLHMDGAGLDAVHALPRLPIIGLTALGRGDEAQRWLAAGVSGVLAKPITAAKLFAALTTAITPDTSASRSWAPAYTPQFR